VYFFSEGEVTLKETKRNPLGPLRNLLEPLRNLLEAPKLTSFNKSLFKYLLNGTYERGTLHEYCEWYECRTSTVIKGELI